MDNSLRKLGLIPLFFFCYQFYQHTVMHHTGYMLWMCNASTGALAVGLLCGWPWLVRVATLWLIPGLPLWVYDMTQYGISPLSSFLEHIGGAGLGVFAVSRIGTSRRMWVHALLWFVLVQQAARMFTSPGLNVNTAHVVHSSVARFFPNYFTYWLACLLVAATVLFGLGLLLQKWFPPRVTAETPPHGINQNSPSNRPQSKSD